MGLANKYDQFYTSNLIDEMLPTIVLSGWPKNRVEAIIYMPGEGDVILDVGCGNGLLLNQFRKRYRHLIGLEFSSQRLEQAKINLSTCNFTGVCGTAESMQDIENGSVDRIISADTIEHIPDVYAAVSEFYRVLKPNGQLIINTPNIAFIKKRALLLFGRFPSTSQPNEGLGSDILFDGGHLHYFTFRALTLVLQRAGFSITRNIGYGKMGRIHDLYPPLLSGGVQLVAIKK